MSSNVLVQSNQSVQYDYSQRPIDNGYKHTIILTDTGEVKTVGANDEGQLGIDDSDPPPYNIYYSFQDVVIPLLGSANVVSVAAGAYHSLILLSSGKVLGFGNNEQGQVGTGAVGTAATDNIPTPNPITNYNGANYLTDGLDNYTGNKGIFSAYDGSNAKDIFAGFNSSALITTSGTLLLWGQCNMAQFGLGETYPTPTHRVGGKVIKPIEPNRTGGYDGSNAKQVAFGSSHILLLLTNGKVLSAGDKSDNKLGFTQTNNTYFQSVFKEIDSSIVPGYDGSNAKQVACGRDHSAVLLKTGTVVTFGKNYWGPVNNSITSGATYIECGQTRTFVLMNTGIIKGFGQNGTYSRIGVNDVTTTKFTTPQNVHKDINSVYDQTNAIFISSKYDHSIIVTKEFKILGFGYNYQGQLGVNSISSTPSGVEKIPRLIDNELVMLTEIIEKYNTIYSIDDEVRITNNVGIGGNNPQALLHTYKSTDDITLSDIKYSNVLRLTSQYESGTHKRGPLITFTNSIPSNYGYGGLDSITGSGSEYFLSAIGSHQRGTDNWNGALSFYTKPAGISSTLQERMTIDYNGNVGIGTDNPKAKLEIAGFMPYSKDAGLNPTVYYLTNVGAGTYSGYTNKDVIETTDFNRSTSSFPLAIKAHGLIYSTTYVGASDSRIKENIRDVSDNIALQKLRDISCVHYEYKDKFARGFDTTIGFIAQQVREHLHMAVSIQQDIIPNEMRVIETPQWTEINDGSDNKFKLTISDLEDVSGNTKYRFYVSTDLSGNNECEKEIHSLEDEPNSFIFDQSWNNVFLYGKEVDDFHTLDKQKLFALNFSATQEIDRVQQQQLLDISGNTIGIEVNKNELELLKLENQELTNKVTSLETELNNLKTIVELSLIHI